MAAVLLLLAAAGCRHAHPEYDPGLLMAIERLDSPSIEEREEASETLARAPLSVLPLLEEALATASGHEMEYRVLRAADLMLVRDRVRIVPEVDRGNSRGDRLCTGLDFTYDVSSPMDGIGDFRVEVQEALDETGKPVLIERTVDFRSMASTGDAEALRAELSWRVNHPRTWVKGFGCRIVSMRGTLRFAGRTGDTSLPFRLEGLDLRCGVWLTAPSNQSN